MEEQNNKNQINIELKEEIAQGIYSNLAIISHSSSEFVLDFVRIMPGIPKAEVKSRIILTPEHAKRLLLALSDNMSKYETNHGTVKVEDKGPGFAPLGYN
ncbi:MAG: DUF3467 domain-containing protein [Bacteroidales bacterium]|jgi:uncharacterized protein (DUF1778 family)|nr:DUF3467 domain-containing protein [Bacteroidales bacterium]